MDILYNVYLQIPKLIIESDGEKSRAAGGS